MIAAMRTTKAFRNAVFALTLTLIGAASITHPSAAQAQTFAPAANGVIVLLTVKAGVTREQVMATMPAEIQQRVLGILHFRGIATLARRPDRRVGLFNRFGDAPQRVIVAAAHFIDHQDMPQRRVRRDTRLGRRVAAPQGRHGSRRRRPHCPHVGRTVEKAAVARSGASNASN